MLLSMTGFSSHTEVLSVKKGAEKIALSIDLKSLNSRFFESMCKLPNSLSYLEIPIANSLKQKLLRGRVVILVKIGGGGEAFETVVPTLKIAKGYCDAAKMLQKKLSLAGELAISDIVRLDRVFAFESEPIGKRFEQMVLAAVEKASERLVASRKAEGKRLGVDLKKRFALCRKYIDHIKKIFAQFMREKKEEIKNLIILADNGDREADAQLDECYEFLNKIDINEEIVRFTSHLKNAQKVLVSKDVEKGKRFEFILQELAREMNTIAAKCSHFDISSKAVDVKVELEKIREQVQNLV